MWPNFSRDYTNGLFYYDKLNNPKAFAHRET